MEDGRVVIEYLTDLFLPAASGRAVAPAFAGQLTAWDPATSRNTVALGDPGAAGTVVLVDLPVVNAAGLVLGPVALLRTAGRPMILGPLAAYVPPAPVIPEEG